MKKGFFENIFLNFKKINNNNFLNIDMLKFFVNKSLSNKEKENVQQHDYTEMKAFYYMVLKMKKKRPHINVIRLMSGLYGSFFDKINIEDQRK